MTSSHHLAARDALRGLAIGDAFGAQFFVPDNLPHLRDRRLVPPVWPWTDDTEMACSIFAALREHGGVDQDELAESFAQHHDFDRGYGPAMNRMLRLVRQREGGGWRKLAGELFDGQGSWGNGAAMRVAPLGAWFAVDPAETARQAARSAEVTHTHPEAVAGAVAVALAAAWAVRARNTPLSAEQLLTAVLELTPPSRVRDGIAEARTLLPQPDVRYVVHRLGNGRQVSAVDTVPFTLWCAARHLSDFQQALWTTASAGGDVDTTCAIVGGIVGAHLGAVGLPADWLAATEPLPDWLDAGRLGEEPDPAD
ncbi:ADP-ribosylglycohydrolase family protein [Kitasatospora azatica]|uniref:ADP-ribosylglycohydrolase family protein n=1 Tax=Kitasatospora azatica TaxID=58347 RepID=UPI0005610659|nr:ADP-ribosylglycohydrolase family protein [Kitasatospora azatica]